MKLIGYNDAQENRKLMDSCREVVVLLYEAMRLRADETLSRESKALIRLHLRSCAGCRALVEEEPHTDPIPQAA
jgi:Fe-S oxidoreductase